MKQTYKWVLILGISLIALVLILLPIISEETPRQEPIPGSTSASPTFVPPPFPEPGPQDPSAPTQTLPDAYGIKPEQTERVEQTSPQTTAPPATQPPVISPAPPAPTQSVPVQPAPTSPPPTEPALRYLSLPYEIPGSDLVVTQYNPFSGIYLEDGSDRAVANAAALMVENRGAHGLEYGEILLTLESGTVLKFEITTLPAGASLIVQEADARPWEDSRILSCAAQTALLEAFPMSSDHVQVTELSDGILSVTNLTAETIPAVRVFYKFYMEDVNGYIGGITYAAKVTDLAPGATQNIDASHYIAGFSTVVMVRTYDSAD